MASRSKHPAYRSLVKKWRSCSFGRAPFIFPDDDVLSEKRSEKHVCIIRSFADYVRDERFSAERDKKLHLGLLPRPYSGSLAKARIFILLLNPGLQPLDYYAEGKKSVRVAAVADIHQRRKGRYPFPALDPDFSWLGGARYWPPRISEHVQKLLEANGGNYYKALAKLSKSICVVQLVPYHSRSFGLPRRIISKLESTNAIRRFVREVIVPEAKRGRTLLIVARRAKQWGIRQSKHVIVYRGSESRAGYVSLSSRGGRAMARFLGI